MQPSNCRSNTQLLQDLFSAESHHDAWADTLQWLYSLDDVTPPPFRYSIFGKLNVSQKQQILDLHLNLLQAIRLASSGPTTTALPEYETSTLPLLRLFFLAEAVLLSPSLPAEDRKYKRLLPKRLATFREGHFRQMFTNLYAQSPAPQQQSESTPDPEHINRTVETAVRNDDFSEALKRLDPEPRALLTTEYLRILKDMHPDPVSPIDHPASLPPTSASVFHLDLLDLTVCQSKRGKAPGFLGDSPDLLFALAQRTLPLDSSIKGSDLLNHLADLFLTGRVPSPAWALLREEVLMALHKDYPARPKKLRPIAIGSAFRRLLLRHMVKTSARSIAAHCLPYQFAIGTSGGTDFIIHTLMAAVQALSTPPASLSERIALLKLDFTNMFNQASRKAAREELTQFFPDWIWIFDNLYPTDGNRVWFQHPDGSWDFFIQVEGFAQGCPGSPFFSSLPLRRLLAQLQQALDQRKQDRQASVSSFAVCSMDDTYAVASLLDVAFIFQFLSEHGPPLGLVLNCEKCHILLSTSGISPIPTFPTALSNELTWAADTFCNGSFDVRGLIVLGTPIGHPSFLREQLEQFLTSFHDTTDLLQNRVLKPATRFKLFLSCLQMRTPSRQFIDGCLPDTLLSPLGGASALIVAIRSQSQQFLSHLLRLDTVPNHAWTLASLPVREGGLGVLDPQLTAPLAFLRPLLRSIRYATLGFPIPAMTLDRSGPTAREDATLWLSLPQYLTTPLATWSSSPIPWLQRFRTLLPWYVHKADPALDILPLITDKEAKPFQLLQQTQCHIQLDHYELARSSFPEHVRRAERSLRSTFTSVALTSLPQHVASFRTPDHLYLLALQRKLRLPINPSPVPCPCGNSIDIYGDHVFACPKHSKSALHNRIRDAFFYVLRHLAPYANMVTADVDVACEPTSLLPTFPTIRPADVALRLVPGTFPFSVSHLLLDFTSTPMPSSTPPAASSDPYLSLVTEHHEVYENGKFIGRHRSGIPRGTITAAILRQKYCLIPFTFDPGGQLGPLGAGFLWDHGKRPSSALPL